MKIESACMACASCERVRVGVARVGSGVKVDVGMGASGVRGGGAVAMVKEWKSPVHIYHT